jgi:uncharacterized membrane protein YjfL (UPF0719 family)
MRNLSSSRLGLVALVLLGSVHWLSAATAPEVPSTWHAQSLVHAIGLMVLFAAIGIAVAVIGYRLFDKMTPGDMHKEIFENRNVAAAIVAAAVILGLSIIIAASMLG